MEDILKEFKRDQGELIHILHRTQSECGYISPESISAIAKHLRISESMIFGVLTFYKAFSLQPRGKHLITICMGTACHVRGAPRILDELQRELCIKAGETTEDGQFTLETVNCVGACALGPIVISDGEYRGQMQTRDVKTLLGDIKGIVEE
jgi:NADH-quinone oxidoreductase subunit E